MQKKSVGSKIFDTANIMIFIVLGLICLLPFVFVLSASFSSSSELIKHDFILFPVGFTLENYKYIFITNHAIPASVMVSIFVTVTGTLINLIVTSLMAYPLSHTHVIGYKIIMPLVIFTLVFSGGMIPTYILISKLGWLDTYWSVLIPNAVTAYNLIIFISFFKSLPAELEEAAKLDGCNDVRTLFQIILPLCKPLLATFTLMFAVGHWNSWFDFVLYIVTLYGLLETGRLLHRREVVDYVRSHVELCTSFYSYCLWDKEKYGAASVNSLLSDIDSLDDCGSFASTMLEAETEGELTGGRAAADDIADYIESRQSRLSDGSLYRRKSSLVNMTETMWLDDLYMSVPFLVRYAALTGDAKYFDDAARQFLLYREKMFLPQWKVLSHVYLTDQKMDTGIPWGRGNGWVAFSLSELLMRLPKEHPLYQDLVDFYNEICQGYLALQDEEGMWHQVLNDPESYPEASCTSMFVAAFARGARLEFLREPRKYAAAARRGFDALARYMIDKNGNIYGICRGSGYSFTPRYYKYDLNWILNDTHGIGILLLAGVEISKMNRETD